MTNDKCQMTNDEIKLMQSLDGKIGKLSIAMEKARIDEYTTMLTHPWKFFFLNLGAGIFRGVGMAVGFTLIAAVLFYIVAKILMTMVDWPIIGMYIGEMVNFVGQYTKGMPTN